MPQRIDPAGCGCTDCITGESTPVDRVPRHDADGQPYIAYFTRDPWMTYFTWNGVLADAVQVTHAEAGEPVTDAFLLTGGFVSLPEFKRQCDVYNHRQG